MKKLNKAKTACIVMAVVSVVLLISTIYLSRQTTKADYTIRIGVPFASEDGTEGFDFTGFRPITDKDEAAPFILSLMNAEVIERPEVCDKQADWYIEFEQYMLVRDERGYGFAYRANLWEDNGDLIVEVITGEGGYKIIRDADEYGLIDILMQHTPVK